jgi:hypothetical protein
MEYHGVQYMPSEPPIKNAKLGKELLFIGRAKVPKYNIGSDNTIVSRTSYAS